MPQLLLQAITHFGTSTFRSRQEDMTNIEKKTKDTERLIQTIQQQVAEKALGRQQLGVLRKPDIGYIA
jgi:proteasome assembly chaperone (PAC2) family protein